MLAQGPPCVHEVSQRRPRADKLQHRVAALHRRTAGSADLSLSPVPTKLAQVLIVLLLLKTVKSRSLQIAASSLIIGVQKRVAAHSEHHFNLLSIKGCSVRAHEFYHTN